MDLKPTISATTSIPVFSGKEPVPDRAAKQDMRKTASAVRNVGITQQGSPRGHESAVTPTSLTRAMQSSDAPTSRLSTSHLRLLGLDRLFAEYEGDLDYDDLQLRVSDERRIKNVWKTRQSMRALLTFFQPEEARQVAIKHARKLSSQLTALILAYQTMIDPKDNTVTHVNLVTDHMATFYDELIFSTGIAHDAITATVKQLNIDDSIGQVFFTLLKAHETLILDLPKQPTSENVHIFKRELKNFIQHIKDAKTGCENVIHTLDSLSVSVKPIPSNATQSLSTNKLRRMGLDRLFTEYEGDLDVMDLNSSSEREAAIRAWSDRKEKRAKLMSFQPEEARKEAVATANKMSQLLTTLIGYFERLILIIGEAPGQLERFQKVDRMDWEIIFSSTGNAYDAFTVAANILNIEDSRREAGRAAFTALLRMYEFGQTMEKKMGDPTEENIIIGIAMWQHCILDLQDAKKGFESIIHTFESLTLPSPPPKATSSRLPASPTSDHSLTPPATPTLPSPPPKATSPRLSPLSAPEPTPATSTRKFERPRARVTLSTSSTPDSTPIKSTPNRAVRSRTSVKLSPSRIPAPTPVKSTWDKVWDVCYAYKGCENGWVIFKAVMVVLSLITFFLLPLTLWAVSKLYDCCLRGRGVEQLHT